jgi:hypothetical protein
MAITELEGRTQAVIAFDIDLGFEAQDQRLRCVDIRAAVAEHPINNLGAELAMQGGFLQAFNLP